LQGNTENYRYSSFIIGIVILYDLIADTIIIIIIIFFLMRSLQAALMQSPLSGSMSRRQHY